LEFGQQFGTVATEFRCRDCTALPPAVLPEKEQFVDLLGRHPRNAFLGRAAFPMPTEGGPGSCDVDLSVMLTPPIALGNRKVSRPGAQRERRQGSVWIGEQSGKERLRRRERSEQRAGGY